MGPRGPLCICCIPTLKPEPEGPIYNFAFFNMATRNPKGALCEVFRVQGS